MNATTSESGMFGDSSPGGRRIVLQGAVNFRDLGGYRGIDGRRIKPGHLYRSDSLANLTEADLHTVANLRLRTLCDLRHAEERSVAPDRLRPEWDLRVHAIGFYPHGGEAMMKRVRSRSIGADEAHQAMRELYAHFPLDNAPVYTRMMHALLRPDALPALVHCTSGKDRTGFGIAIVLSALGVPRETILRDYLLTNAYRRDLAFMLGNDVDPEVLDRIKAAAPEYLAAAFATIDANWGGDTRFLIEGLGIPEDGLRDFRESLLETGTKN
ncbi:MAG: tyrosine-protein phosphatase [Rudaea sp.]|uniref:tyrosine-protein phosphatase n=1 Tax=Rudaea sp. TaxID=2136325 RepID=UPI0039E72169